MAYRRTFSEEAYGYAQPIKEVPSGLRNQLIEVRVKGEKAIKRTATRDLTDLVNVALLEKHGQKKGTYYTLKLFKGQR